MTDEIGYADAIRELDDILEELERDDLDVDVLAVRVQRASELIQLCRGRIARAQADVDRVVTDLESLERTDADRSAGDPPDRSGVARRWGLRPLAGELAVLELRLHVVAVEEGDEVDADLLRARLLALAVVGAGAEEALHHLDHVDHPLVALGLALREQAEVRDLGRGEQLGGAVGARGHARAAADARGGVHRRVGGFLGHRG